MQRSAFFCVLLHKNLDFAFFYILFKRMLRSLVLLCSLQKNVAFFAFFYVLKKRTQKNDAFRTQKTTVPNPGFALHHRVNFRGVHCASHCGINLRGVHHTAESIVHIFQESRTHNISKSPRCASTLSQSPRIQSLIKEC